MTIDDQIRDEKLQDDINREAAKIWWCKIKKYEYLIDEEILLSNQKQIIEQTKFINSLLSKAFERAALKSKELETTEDKSDDKPLIEEKSLEERMYEIQKMSHKINFNNLTYYFRSSNLAPINFIGFRGPMHIYNEIKNGNVSIKKAEEDQKKFKSGF